MGHRFRGDVEGLRALAIGPILMFHLDPAWSPGRFIGVDIFFVISGTLITQMILREGDQFRLSSFYVRRFFRLFPALLVTLAACLAGGWFVLGAQDYSNLGLPAISAAFGVSNLYFLSAIDYFNASSLSHPLSAFPTILTIDPKVQFCTPAACRTTGEEGLFFRDKERLTNAGSAFLVSQVKDILLEKLSKK